MSTNSEQLLNQAANVIAAQLGLQAGDVVISTGDIPNKQYMINGQQIHDGNRDGKNTNLVINIKGLDYDLDPAKTEFLVSESLAKLPPITAISRVVSDDKMALEIHDKLQKLTEGTNFNPQLLKWAGFDPDVVSGDWKCNDYSESHVKTNAYGIELEIMVHPDKEHTPNELVDKIEENFKERLPEIKELLTQRTVKYITLNLQKDGKPDAEIEEYIAKIREQMAKLEIDINKDDRGIRFAIRSPEQAKANEALLTNRPDNEEELRNTNPLQRLTEVVSEQEKETNPQAAPQLQKTLSRAFLYGGGEKAMEIFPMIAGRRDMVSAIQKEAKKVIAEHPEKEAAFKEIIDSPLFDKQTPFNGLDEAGVAPPRPVYYKTPDDATLKVAIKIDKTHVHKVLEELANAEQIAQQPAAELAAVPQIPPISAIAPKNFKKELSAIDGILGGIKSVLPKSWVTQVAPPEPQPQNAVNFR